MGTNQQGPTDIGERPRSVSTGVRLRRGVAALAAVLGVAIVPDATVPVVSAAETNRSHRSSSLEIAAAASVAIEAHQMWEHSGRATVYLEYLDQRRQVAALVARDLALGVDEVERAWAEAEPRKQRALLTALTQLGVPYESMASRPGEGFDCSGLIVYAWSQAGVDLPRSSGDQIRAGASIGRDEAGAGDLAYYPGHVMMYLGVDDAVVHSPNSGNLVEIRFVSRSLRYGDPLGT